MSGSEIAGDQLRTIVERIENVEAEIKELTEGKKEIYLEAKGNGFDVKIMRKVVALRRQDLNKRREEEELLDVYMSALGMHPGDDVPGLSPEVRRLAKNPKLRAAVKAFGMPVELTEEEKAAGATAAFVKDGTRMSIGLGRAHT
jgi:uncharacterized protein (UPF0335 family)